MKINYSFVVFMIGLIPLAYSIEYLKSKELSGWIVFGVAAIYLVVLRLFGDFIENRRGDGHE